jgi:hypothetical protein
MGPEVWLTSLNTCDDRSVLVFIESWLLFRLYYCTSLDGAVGTAELSRIKQCFLIIYFYSQPPHIAVSHPASRRQCNRISTSRVQPARHWRRTLSSGVFTMQGSSRRPTGHANASAVHPEAELLTPLPHPVPSYPSPTSPRFSVHPLSDHGYASLKPAKLTSPTGSDQRECIDDNTLSQPHRLRGDFVLVHQSI